MPKFWEIPKGHGALYRQIRAVARPTGQIAAVANPGLTEGWARTRVRWGRQTPPRVLAVLVDPEPLSGGP